MKLRIDKESEAYMDFITKNPSTDYVFVGSSQIFLDKILWMDEHFGGLPNGYDSILEVERFAKVENLIFDWKWNNSFSTIDEAQNNLYRKALDYLYKYRKQKVRKRKPKIPKKQKKTIYQVESRTKKQGKVSIKHFVEKTNSSSRHDQRLLQKEQQEPYEVLGINEKSIFELEQREKCTIVTQPTQTEEVEKKETAENEPKNSTIDEVAEEQELEDVEETKDAPLEIEKEFSEQETKILIEKRALRVLKGWEKRRVTLYGRRFRKESKQNGAVQRWRRTEKIYEPVILPNGKGWNDVVSAFKEKEQVSVLRCEQKPAEEEPQKNNAVQEEQVDGVSEEKTKPVGAKKEYKPLTALTTRNKEAKANIELLKVQARIPTVLKTKIRKIDFYVWLLLSKNFSESRAEDTVHLMDICDEVSAELGISDIKLREIEDTEELVNYVESLEADYRFRKIDRKFFCRITQSLEWYCEFAAEYAQDAKE